MSRQIMIDIETLSSRPDAAVIAVGMVAFNIPSDPEDQDFHKLILIDPRLTPGHRDANTLDWWREQPQEVFNHMMSGVLSPWQACGVIAGFALIFGEDVPVWANPPTFDLSVLREMFKACEIDFPIAYKRERDYRTIRKLADEFGVNYESAFEGQKKHNALDDAIAQAEALKIMFHDLALEPPRGTSEAAQAMRIEKIRNTQ